ASINSKNVDLFSAVGLGFEGVRTQQHGQDIHISNTSLPPGLLPLEARLTLKRITATVPWNNGGTLQLPLQKIVKKLMLFVVAIDYDYRVSDCVFVSQFLSGLAFQRAIAALRKKIACERWSGRGCSVLVLTKFYTHEIG
uniref:Uncharacterized protein n=1 Tax=Glossina palpalis gambiensis TaxID=67801 RepID=A0A1B0AXB0_9MUSC